MKEEIEERRARAVGELHTVIDSLNIIIRRLTNVSGYQQLGTMDASVEIFKNSIELKRAADGIGGIRD